MRSDDQYGSRQMIILCRKIDQLGNNQKVKAIFRKMDSVQVEIKIASMIKPEVGLT